MICLCSRVKTYPGQYPIITLTVIIINQNFISGESHIRYSWDVILEDSNIPDAKAYLKRLPDIKHDDVSYHKFKYRRINYMNMMGGVINETCSRIKGVKSLNDIVNSHASLSLPSSFNIII